MKDFNHNDIALEVCKYVLSYIRARQKILESQGLFQNRMALLEEYREWISDGIDEDYILYLISKKEKSDTN